MPAQQYCPACYPNKVRSHAGIYLSDFLDILLGGIFTEGQSPQLPRFPKWFSVTHYWYKLMALVRIVHFSDVFEKKDHYPRSWAVIEEAKKRGIKLESVHILGRVSTYYRVRFGSKYYYYDAVPSRFLNFRLDEKHYVKKRLLKYGFPASVGKMFWSARRALRYGRRLGFSLAVKPSRGTHAYHVTAPVQNETELKTAIALAKQYQPRLIVERYLTGNLYRVTIINFNHVYCARREAPNVVGDGVHMIAELIEGKNADPRRGETGQKDTTLHKIPMPAPHPNPLPQGEREQYKNSPSLVGGARGGGERTTTDAALARAGLTSDYVPRAGEKIILHNKTSIGSGGDIIEETELLHPENREMFRRAAQMFGADLIGFDVIAEDLGKPYHQQQCGIIEANSIPMIDFHAYPALGKPQLIAAALWDAIIADKRVRYLYPVMLPERSLGTRLMWHFLDVAMPFTVDFLLRFRLIRKLSRRQRFLVGHMKPDVTPESAITHLKMNGFEVVRPEWIDQGEIMGLRKLLDHEKQCHIRFFDDGEVRAHVEYAPEARPIAHLVEQGFHAAHDLVHEFLHHYVVRHENTSRSRAPLS